MEEEGNHGKSLKRVREEEGEAWQDMFEVDFEVVLRNLSRERECDEQVQGWEWEREEERGEEEVVQVV